jgi:hypothetical protein
MTENFDYDALAARAEAGELRSIPGTTTRAADAPNAGRDLLMLATGTNSIEEATRVALGRPRLDAEPREKKLYWKVRPTEQLDEMVKSFVREHDMNVSDLVRKGVFEYIQNHSTKASEGSGKISA